MVGTRDVLLDRKDAHGIGGYVRRTGMSACRQVWFRAPREASMTSANIQRR